MAYGTLLDINQISKAFKAVETTIHLPQGGEGDETGGGEVLVAASFVRLWEGTITFVSDEHNSIDALAARVNSVLTPGRRFALHTKHRRGPTGDPYGTLLGANTPQLGSVNANMQDVTITGLPATYPGLGTGSYLSFSYDTGRQAFHQVAIGAVAVGGSASVSLVPPVRPGYSLGAAVALIDPFLHAVILSDSLRPARYLAGHGTGLSFDWRQTLGRP